MAKRNRSKNKKMAKPVAKASFPAARPPRPATEADAIVGATPAQSSGEIAQVNINVVERTEQPVPLLDEPIVAAHTQPSPAILVDEGEKTLPRAAESRAVLAEMTWRLLREWSNFVRKRQTQSFEGIGALMRCYTPWDFVATQTALMQDGIEDLVAYGRRLAESGH